MYVQFCYLVTQIKHIPNYQPFVATGTHQTGLRQQKLTKCPSNSVTFKATVLSEATIY